MRDGRLYASENHQEILKVQNPVQHYHPKCYMGFVCYFKKITQSKTKREKGFSLFDWYSLVMLCSLCVFQTGQEADKGPV